MSDWVVEHHPETGSTGTANTTLSFSPKSGHLLSVTHEPENPRYTHAVRVGTPSNRVVLSVPAKPRHDYEAERRANIRQNSSSNFDEVPDPSPELLTMIEHHHEDPTNSWYALLDKLVEEYPDHFDAVVSAHTAARQSNAAEHYARAFAATQRS